ncbi:MAG: class I SAM-dependent methyltransferase [Anaerolineales bacterium]|nr:class I SAM-dependent methyltransferase [Anaerolineales bacterium]MCW5856338.1 class I SAM-dependent methyltransferase [Anaerolineales bacterium]
MSNKPDLIRVSEGLRVAYYRVSANSRFWDDLWASQETQRLYENAQKGELGYFDDIFPKYLPTHGRILEAGCGLGQFVIALRQRGYQVEGVDYGEQTINALNKTFPKMNFLFGDVTKLDAPDGHYHGYISLGVMEHRQEGPEPFLKEANRVLAPDGIALISVPHLNAIRTLKKAFGFFRKPAPAGLSFYQYLYSSSEFNKKLNDAGFQVIAHHQYDGHKGLVGELPWLMKLYNLPKVGWRIYRVLRDWRWANDHMGHMMMYVCRKMQP